MATRRRRDARVRIDLHRSVTAGGQLWFPRMEFPGIPCVGEKVVGADGVELEVTKVVFAYPDGFFRQPLVEVYARPVQDQPGEDAAPVEGRVDRPRKIRTPDVDPDVATLRAYVMGCVPPGSAHIYFGGSPPNPPSTNDALAALDRLAARTQS